MPRRHRFFFSAMRWRLDHRAIFNAKMRTNDSKMELHWRIFAIHFAASPSKTRRLTTQLHEMRISCVSEATVVGARVTMADLPHKF